jgi:hypothetical protein
MTALLSDGDGGLPIEQFIQALTSQLDRAQSALALKARAGLPLTFAVKDLTLDLRAHVDVSGSVVRIRPAGPGERDASMLHVSLTTITKPMIEENTSKFSMAAGEQPLKEVVGDQLNDDELRRLEWAGVQTVSQFEDLQQHAGTDALERVAQVPALRLRAALARAAAPYVGRLTLVDRPPEDGAPTPPVAPSDPIDSLHHLSVNSDAATESPPLEPRRPTLPLIEVSGRNLVGRTLPIARIGGSPVPILEASKGKLLLAPREHHLGLVDATLEIETAPGVVITKALSFGDDR